MGSKRDKVKEKVASLLVAIFRYLPIKKNKVLMMSYYGKGYDCNPKYLTEYLVAHQKQYPWNIVWVFNDVRSHDTNKGIRKVKIMSLMFFYELCTAKVIITNFRMMKWFKKRKKQYYIQTWHSSLRLKAIEKDAESSLTPDYIEMAKNDSKQCDALISGCKFSTEIFRRSFWYEGKILEYGIPRNDVLLNKDLKQVESIKKKLGIGVNQKILLYAPTFRKSHDMSVYDLPYEQLGELLNQKWGGEWLILVRLHPHLQSKGLKINWSEQIRDASGWEDVQELLLVADVLISDYSSLIFDYRFTGRPCFLYVPDLDKYVANDRELYFNIQDLPFESAKSYQLLKQKIEAFDYIVYEKKLQDFEQQVGNFEDGKACERLAEEIAEMMSK